MSVNWQAYLDGSLDLDQRHTADELLSRSEDARRQLQTLVDFRRKIKEAGHSAPVPLASLERGLKSIAMRPRTAIGRRAWGGALALSAVAMMAALYVWLVPQPIEDTNFATNSPAEASRWVASKTGMAATPYSIAGGKLIMAEAGNGWGCFCWSVDGEIIHVALRQDDAQIQGLTRQVRNGKEIFVGKAIGFRSGGLTYYVHGGSEKTRWKVVAEIS